MEEEELENSVALLEGSFKAKMESAIVDHLVDNSLSVLATEASLLWGVRDAVNDIKKELESMRSLLEDADKKGASNEGEKTWVANVRDMTYDVTDVIDEFLYHINIQRMRGRFVRFLHQTIYFPQSLWVRHQTATKLQKINKTIKAIPEMNQRYVIDSKKGTTKDNQEWVMRRGESSLFLKEDELVGIKKKRKLLMGWLMNGGEPQQTVILVVGWED